ncbi:von Willebrand factor D and EGF domain-containing protein [Lingula anatina]|uniref:von Willebrand factor D and EGF domain-containing protein n=1 Tax=Lingula anatina TaxID=7574 RepID=A0A1S3J5X1_LINAN|nr:von Willebrand factor D and EGF domain-containing protein [Lingula anatina]|eukprot:XP_013405703.1 von Willebrand factor D and EGF domain-containing protein [Lingula anatina]
MRTSLGLVILCAFLVGTCITFGAVNLDCDPCENTCHVELYNGDRYHTHKPTPNQPFLCDDAFIDGLWYRFIGKAGSKLADHLVKPFSCGTMVPVYLDGQHPQDYTETTQKVCVNYGLAPCFQFWNIKVKRCQLNNEDYYVYQLPPTPGCNVAYCGAGEQVERCPTGEFKLNGRCVTKLPVISITNVIIETPVVEERQVIISCRVTYNVPAGTRDEGDVKIRVSYLADNALIDDDVTTGARGRASRQLRIANLTGNLGKYLSCNASSFWVNYNHLPTASAHATNNYYAGIKVVEKTSGTTPKRIVLAENSPQYEIQVYSTIPIAVNTHTSHKYEDGKTYVQPLELKVETTILDSVIYNGSPKSFKCAVSFTEDSWDDKLKRAYASSTLKMLAQRDGRNDGARDSVSRLLQFRPINIFQGFPPAPARSIWHGYQMEEIPIYTTDVADSECRSYNDPRIETFDRYSYFSQRAGEFVLAKSQTRDFEVQVRHWKCRSYQTCNCAVAARENNDVYILDVCHNVRQRRAVVPRILRRSANDEPPADGAHIKSDQNGRKYIINFPSGAYVIVDIRYFGLNLYVHVPSDDRGKVEGLCGNNNGNRNDERRDIDRSESSWHQRWRVKPETNYFNKSPKYKEQSQEPLYCHCHKNDSVVADATYLKCDFDKRVTQPDIISKKNLESVVPRQVVEFRNLGRRKRRDIPEASYTDEASDYQPYVFTFKEDYSKPVVNLTWPTPSGITQTQAAQLCRDTLANSSVVNLCQEVPGFDPFENVPKCIDDILVADDMGFANEAVTEMVDTCIATAVKEVLPEDKDVDSLGPTTTTTATQIPHLNIAELTEKIKTNACPRECSQKGKCVDGNCVCEAGFMSADCSVNSNISPEITEVQNAGLCDVQTRPCLKFRVLVDPATPVTRSDRLSCRVTKAQIDISTGTYTILPATTGHAVAEFVSFSEVTCHLPRDPIIPPVTITGTAGTPAQGFLLSISNDGVKFGKNESFVTLFDSACVDCKPFGQCTKKRGTCLINGYCYEDGDRNPANWCFEIDSRLQ